MRLWWKEDIRDLKQKRFWSHELFVTNKAEWLWEGEWQFLFQVKTAWKHTLPTFAVLPVLVLSSIFFVARVQGPSPLFLFLFAPVRRVQIHTRSDKQITQPGTSP